MLTEAGCSFPNTNLLHSKAEEILQKATNCHKTKNCTNATD
jgi:hypothetical protein